ncbi:pimeloyl-ACP methyl ester carboxylesterase [Bradyrhizobium sp. JR6.1]
MNPATVAPTIVLVHGAFEDASIWNKVIERLQRAGYPVVAFANPLLGVAVDAAYLRSVLDRIQGPVILAAHSYGGAVITEAGTDPKVKGLVYAAAVMPAAGEAASNLLERFPGSTFPTSVEAVTYSLPDGTSGTYLLYRADKFHSNVAADVPASEAAMMLATQRADELGSPDRDADIRCMDEQAELANQDLAGSRHSSGRTEVRS